MAARNPTGKGGFRKGHDARRSTSKPLMAAQREALRLIKEGTPKAVMALLKLLDDEDGRIVMGSAKILLDKGLPQQLIDNLFQVPDDLLDRPAAERLAWVEDRFARIAEIRQLMRAEAEAERQGASVN